MQVNTYSLTLWCFDMQLLFLICINLCLLVTVSKAGIIILPDMVNQQQYNNDYDNDKDAGENEIFEIDRGVVKWPKKTVLLDTDMFDVDDSWHDTPPEGFSLTVRILEKK